MRSSVLSLLSAKGHARSPGRAVFEITCLWFPTSRSLLSSGIFIILVIVEKPKQFLREKSTSIPRIGNMKLKKLTARQRQDETAQALENVMEQVM